MSNDLPTIDLELGKKLAGGKANFAIEMIEMLQESLPKDYKEIETAYQSEDYTHLQKSIHKLHGAVCYCGTPALKEATANLETALKAQQTPQIPVLFEIFKNAVEKVLAEKVT